MEIICEQIRFSDIELLFLFIKFVHSFGKWEYRRGRTITWVYRKKENWICFGKLWARKIIFLAQLVSYATHLFIWKVAVSINMILNMIFVEIFWANEIGNWILLSVLKIQIYTCMNFTDFPIQFSKPNWWKICWSIK